MAKNNAIGIDIETGGGNTYTFPSATSTLATLDLAETLTNKDLSATKLHVAGAVTQEPLSSDPADPDAGNSVQWVSDGTGSGSAGDVMMKINVGGTTKIATLVDYSLLT